MWDEEARIILHLGRASPGDPFQLAVVIGTRRKPTYANKKDLGILSVDPQRLPIGPSLHKLHKYLILRNDLF